jgi:cytoskeletal protein CcmA (bactofilin family)
MALFSKESEDIQPEQVKEASQSPAVQVFRSLVADRARSVIEERGAGMALLSKESEKTQPEQVKETSQSPAVHSFRSLEDKVSPATQPVPASQAYLDRSSKVEGKLNFEGSARIDGQIEGEILAKDLIIGESALVTAQITVASVIVAGTIKGEIIASQRIEIRASARVSGKITSPILVVHEGAAFEGHCAMQPEKARADRKSTAFPKGGARGGTAERSETSLVV